MITLALWCLAAATPNAPAWMPVNAETSKIADAEGLARLTSGHPNSANLARRQLVASFGAKDDAAALAALTRIEAMGFTFQPASYGQMAPLIGDDRAAQAATLATQRSQPIGSSALAVTIPASIRLTEGVVVDSKGRMFTGSVIEKALYLKEGEGEWRRLPIEGLGGITGLAIDKERGLLWAASGKLDPTPGETAWAGLIAIDLETLREKARHHAPDGVIGLNDIAVAPDGSVLASDSTGGGVYRFGAGQFETLVAPGTFRSPQGIAVHPSGTHAYVADYGYGIAILDLATAGLGRLDAPYDVMLDGTDGLLWHEGNLVALQNGIRPMRIMYLDLDDAGGKVVQAITLERHNPDWGEVTIGQVSGNRLFYIADPQWDRYGDGGAVKGEGPVRPNQVRTLELPTGF